MQCKFYRHHQNWSNRIILGDSLQVMATLHKREGLRGKVQCTYSNLRYDVRFNIKLQDAKSTGMPESCTSISPSPAASP